MELFHVHVLMRLCSTLTTIFVCHLVPIDTPLGRLGQLVRVHIDKRGPAVVYTLRARRTVNEDPLI